MQWKKYKPLKLAMATEYRFQHLKAYLCDYMLANYVYRVLQIVTYESALNVQYPWHELVIIIILFSASPAYVELTAPKRPMSANKNYTLKEYFWSVCLLKPQKKLFFYGGAIKEGRESLPIRNKNFFFILYLSDGEVPIAIKLEGGGARP